MFNSDPVLSLYQADIFQDTKLVLGDVSFDIYKGEFVYLIGRTGSWVCSGKIETQRCAISAS